MRELDLIRGENTLLDVEAAEEQAAQGMSQSFTLPKAMKRIRSLVPQDNVSFGRTHVIGPHL